MAEAVSNRITRLNQLLSGKTAGKKVPLLDKETLLDAFVALYNECNSDYMTKDKNIATYVKKFKPLICEIEKLRLRKNDFEIRKTIGRGHFGEVHVVREKVTGNVYAMKVLKKSETLSQDNVAFFEEERDIMAFAGNPWITSLQYAFQDYESLYLVMDFHPGGDLLSLLAKYDDIFEEDVAQFYLAEMIMAMHAVHVLGYVHRDIKPENVLIDRTGHIKLADFGSSAKLSSTKTVVSKMPVGTPEYIAPEVLTSMDGSGGGGKYGIECDWWSLGVVAYEMMIGNTPFQADSVVVVYSQIMNFKNSLHFPDDQSLTDNAKDLIRSLLTDQKNRIGYSDLAKHPFFTGLDWTTLQDALPPYVPNVQTEDDTSNFDDFETENSGPRIEDFMEQKKGFLGKDLPFIGFTFTKQLTLVSLNETVGESSAPSQGLIAKRASTKREMSKDGATDKQVNALRHDLEKEQKKAKELKQVIEDKLKQIKNIEEERDGLENEKAVFATERKDLKRLYEKEKSQREKLETEISVLQSEVADASKKAEEFLSDKINSSKNEEQMKQLELEKSTLAKKIQHLESDLHEKEKYLEDSKSRISDLQTKLAKVNEDTKSNVTELQQKLFKVNEDNETRIRLFQEKLSKAVSAAQQAVEQLGRAEKEKDDVEKENNELKALLQQTEGEREKQEVSNDEIEKLQTHISTLNKQNDSLKSENKELQSDLDDSRNKYDKLVEFGEDLKAQVERKMEKMQREISSSRKELKKNEESYRKLKEEYDEKNNNLNNSESTIVSLTATCKSLEKQIDEISNNKHISSQQQEQSERMELTHKMNEVNAQKSKIENENTTLKTDLKENQAKLDEFKDKLESIKKQYDELTENSENSISKLNRELQKAMNESKKYQKELTETHNSNDQLKTAVISLEAEANSLKLRSDEEKLVKSKDLESRLNKANVSIDNLKTDKQALENKVHLLTEQLSLIQKEKEQLQEEVNEKDRQANSQDLTIQMLKQTCTMLEGQVEELEVMNDEYQDREAKWDLIKRQQYQAQEQLEQQLTDALNSLEQQRQLKNQANLKLQQLEENSASSQGDVVKKLASLEKLNESLEEKIQELTGSLSDTEKNLGLNMVTIKNLERKLQVESDEKMRLSNEVSHLEDLSSQQTSSNFALTVEIEELKERNDEVLAEKDSAQNQLEQDAIQHAEEKIKLESTLAQQTKLIEFLQKKFVVEDKNYAAKKHKSKGGKLKADMHSTEAAPDMRKTKDLERALEKEKNANLQQHLQLQKARNEMTSLKTELQQLRAAMKSHSNPTTPRLTHKQDVSKTSSSSIYSAKSNSSPSTSVADIYNMAGDSNEVRGNGVVPVEKKNPNNIPHKLHATLNMRPSKCPVCLNTIHFAKQAMKCSECYIVSHAKCASSLPNLCGVPRSLLPQFTINLSRASMILDDGSIAIDVTDGAKIPKVEGWLKFPKKTGTKQSWERKWVVLQDMKLSVFNNDNTVEFDPFDEIDLNISDGELNIHPAIPSSELSWVAPNDLNYVFSVELLPYTLGWPRRTLYFLSPTFSDKQKWVAALEFLSDGVKQKTQKEPHGMVNDIMMSFEGIKHLDVNSSIIINETGSILGCEEGLYVVSMKKGPQKNKPVQIIGLGPVYQMKLVKELDAVLLVTGKDRLFCTISFKDLENRLKQLHMGASISAISPYQIERVKACHLFKVSKTNNEYYACAATTHKLYIFKYNSQIQSFVLKKELETNEAASCLLFTTTSVIYGTSKFHSADLKTYQKRDFLDPSDTSLAFAVFGTTQTRSFPIAVFKVSQGKIRDEFLLCFSEFGIFVDWQGRRSRKGDLKWTRLPMSFEYHHPHLYITHFSSIEICEISTDMRFDISATPRRFIDVPDPRFLGDGFEPSSVLLASTQVKKLEILSHKAPPPLGLSRNMSMSGVSITSGASVANAILEQSGITMDPVLYRSPSKDSVCSDEETSLAIGKNPSGTPRSSRRSDNLRNDNKDKRISFRFFKGNRKSQYES